MELRIRAFALSATNLRVLVVVYSFLSIAAWREMHSQISPDTISSRAQKAFTTSTLGIRGLHLAGNVSWTSGSTHQNGTVDLKAASDGSQSEAWHIGDSSFNLITSSFLEGHNCVLQTGSAAKENTKDSSCSHPTPWFAPWLTWEFLRRGIVEESNDPLTPAALTYELHLADLQESRSQLNRSTNRLAKVTFLLEPTTNNVASLSFSYESSGISARSVSYIVTFDDYRQEGPVVVAHHVQRFIDNTLQADIIINSVAVE